MLRRLLFLLLIPSVASAQAVLGPKHRPSPTTGRGVLKQSAICGDDSSTLRTFSWSGDNGAIGFATAIWWVEFTDGAGTDGALTFSCTVSRDGNVTDYAVTSCSVASGKCTLVLPSSNTIFETPTLTDDTNFWVRWDLLGAADYQCTVAHSQAGADDCWTLYAQLITE